MDETPRPNSYARRWQQAGVGWPSLILLIAVMTGLAAIGASVGGWGGVALIVLTLVAVIALLIVWGGADQRV